MVGTYGQDLVVHNEDGCLASLPPAMRKRVEDKAEELGVDPEYLARLSKDPSNDGNVTADSLREAEVALKGQGAGNTDVLRVPDDSYYPGPLRPVDTEVGDFIDGSGEFWDVKAWDPAQPNNTIDDIVAQIKGEHALGEHILVDTAKMDDDFILNLAERLADEDLTGKVVSLLEEP